MKAKISEIFESLFNQELRLILRNPISIGSISEPSEDLQCTAVRLDEHAINMISKPCERAKNMSYSKIHTTLNSSRILLRNYRFSL